MYSLSISVKHDINVFESSLYHYLHSWHKKVDQNNIIVTITIIIIILIFLKNILIFNKHCCLVSLLGPWHEPLGFVGYVKYNVNVLKVKRFIENNATYLFFKVKFVEDRLSIDRGRAKMAGVGRWSFQSRHDGQYLPNLRVSTYQKWLWIYQNFKSSYLYHNLSNW